MQFELARHHGVDGLKKAAKLKRPMTAMEFADHRARLIVERRKQIGGSVAQVVGSAPLSLARTHRQHRLAAVESLDLGLFINAEHHRPFGRVEIEPYDVAQLLDEQGVFGKLEAFDPVRLQPKCAPNAADHGLAQSAALGHRTRAPMRRIRRGALQGHPHYSFDLGVSYVGQWSMARCWSCARPGCDVRGGGTALDCPGKAFARAAVAAAVYGAQR